MTRVSTRAVEGILAGALAATLPASLVFSRELFVALSGSVALLAALYLAVRPALAVRAFRTCRSHARRVAIAASVALVVVATVAAVGEIGAHPSVDARGEAELWARANQSLGRIVAADLRWQAAREDERATALAELRRATRTFADAVHDLERVRAPEGRGEIHAAATAVYREIADAVGALPDALAHLDADTAAAIWKRAGALSEEASSLIHLTSPDTSTR